LVRRRRGEIAIEQVRSDCCLWAHISIDRCSAAAPASRNAGVAHQSSDAILAAGIAPAAQIPQDPRSAVRSIANLKTRADLHQQQSIHRRPRALRPLQPVVKARTRDTEHLAHLLRLPHPSVLRHESELHFASFAKKAMAFFRMSRSAFVFSLLIHAGLALENPECHQTREAAEPLAAANASSAFSAPQARCL
jgi:hypothetical protein